MATDGPALDPRELAAVFTRAPLAALDARGRADLALAARVRRLDPGTMLFGGGATADSLFVVARGALVVDEEGGPRTHGEGELFGREALVPGARRSGAAVARESSAVLELPLGVLRRVLARSGAGAELARAERDARAAAFGRLVSASELGRSLDAPGRTRLLGALREEALFPGRVLVGAGARSEVAYVVASGLVELRATDGGRVFVTRGELFGLAQALSREPWQVTVTALGDGVALAVPRDTLVALEERHPRAVRAELERQASRGGRPGAGWRGGSALPTRRAEDELPRLAAARSLLAIDLSSCVECGHCAAACAETHGSARLSRRGPKTTVLVSDGAAVRAHAFVLPTACQHCRDPVCLPECPTGAIVRNERGAVLVREAACTGCGACVSACPWDAVALVPREKGVPEPPGVASAFVAAKCDLCDGREGPECVAACPTGAILRIDPERELPEVRAALALLPRHVERATAPRHARHWLVAGALAPLALAVVTVHVTAPATLGSGVAALVPCALLCLHGWVKRRAAARALAVRIVRRFGAGSALPALLRVHAVLGAAAAGAVSWHAGFMLHAGVSGALALSFFASTLTGVLGALGYAFIPRRRARLVGRGALPEDDAARQADLERQRFQLLTGQNAALQALARTLLVPYASSRVGALLLALSKRTSGDEVRALEDRVSAMLGGRSSARLAAAPRLVELSVALRLLRAERYTSLALRAFVPLHLVLAVLVGALVVLHVVGVSS